MNYIFHASLEQYSINTRNPCVCVYTHTHTRTTERIRQYPNGFYRCHLCAWFWRSQRLDILLWERLDLCSDAFTYFLRGPLFALYSESIATNSSTEIEKQWARAAYLFNPLPVLVPLKSLFPAIMLLAWLAEHSHTSANLRICSV